MLVWVDLQWNLAEYASRRVHRMVQTAMIVAMLLVTCINCCMLLVRWWLPLKVGIEVSTGVISRCVGGSGTLAWSFAGGIRGQ